MEERKGGKERRRRLIGSTQEAMRASDSPERPRARESAGNSLRRCLRPRKFSLGKHCAAPEILDHFHPQSSCSIMHRRAILEVSVLFSRSFQFTSNTRLLIALPASWGRICCQTPTSFLSRTNNTAELPYVTRDLQLPRDVAGPNYLEQ